MTELGSSTQFSERLEHEHVQKLMRSLGEAKVINLDTTLRDLMGPLSDVLRPDVAGKASLHIVCCNEYGLVTP